MTNLYKYIYKHENYTLQTCRMAFDEDQILTTINKLTFCIKNKRKDHKQRNQNSVYQQCQLMLIIAASIGR